MPELNSSQTSREIEPNTSLRLTSVLLNGFNYVSWSRAASLALLGRSKLSYVNGKKEAPKPSDPSFDAWQSNDQPVMSWILNSMEPKIAETFVFADSDYDPWSL
ncbi:conserved hypothetical protein [Ricinus communis]|uniref:Retrotransposon Copia-like N-terminal domain-containing protein n=1 Tax=Ricinus communis TaxID=3988 RepID=B9SYP2_RICCO|nr:conserved hypothetical protein [Ricinus communis]